MQIHLQNAPKAKVFRTWSKKPVFVTCIISPLGQQCRNRQCRITGALILTQGCSSAKSCFLPFSAAYLWFRMLTGQGFRRWPHRHRRMCTLWNWVQRININDSQLAMCTGMSQATPCFSRDATEPQGKKNLGALSTEHSFTTININDREHMALKLSGWLRSCSPAF